MWICSSVGSVTIALPLLATVISLLLLFDFLEDDVERLEPLRPRALVVLHPVVDGPECVAVQPVEPLTSFLTHVDRSHLAQHAQVLGHLWLSEPEQVHELVHGPLAAGERVEDLAP